MPSEKLEKIELFLYRKDYKFITDFLTGRVTRDKLPSDFLTANDRFRNAVKDVFEDIDTDLNYYLETSLKIWETASGRGRVQYFTYSLEIPEELNRFDIKTRLLHKVNSSLKSTPYTVGTTPPDSYVLEHIQAGGKKRKSLRKRRSSHRKKH
jgi:hypothetical protein